MKMKTGDRYIFLLLLSLLFISLASAVWYNPFTWFSSSDDTKFDNSLDNVKQPKIQITHSHYEWICQTNADDEYDCIVEDKNKKKTSISFCHKTIKKGDDKGKIQLPNKRDICLDKDCNEKLELNKKNVKSDKIGEDDLVCYERLTDTEEYLKFNPTAVYQNISMVQYINDDLEVNTTIEEGLSDRTGYSVNYPEVLIVDSSKFKFGAEAYNKTNHTEFKYIFESNKPMYNDNFGYYFKGDITQGLLTNTREKIRINLDDICYTSYNETTNTTFYSNCEYNYTTNEIDENTTNHRLEVYFTAEYKGNSTIFIDPSYTIDGETFIDSVGTNITQESNFSHLEISDNSPYDSLVLYMPFDDNVSSTTAYDYSNHNNDGSLNGNTHSVEGLYGKALKFDGSGDYVYVGSGLEDVPDSAFTVSFWAKSDIGYSSDRGAFSFNGLDDLIIYPYDNANGNGVRVFWRNGGLNILNENDATRSGFNHFVYVFNGSNNHTIYSNGEHLLSSLSAVTSSGFSDVYIGSWIGQYFNGLIDEVMVFNSSLTLQQIQDIYNNQSERFKPTGTQEIQAVKITAGNNTINVTTDYQTNLDSNLSLRIGESDITNGYNDSVDGDIDSGLIGYWHFDNRSGYENDSHIFDFSGNGNNGTMQGDASYSDNSLYGKSMYFDNAGDTVTVGDISFSPNSNVTICAWVNGSSFLTDNIISDNSKIFFRTLSSGRLEFIILGLSDDRITSVVGGGGVFLDVGVWTHVCGMYNGTYFSLWENGAFSFADDTGGSWTDSTGTYNIGGRSVSSENWHGNIDELMIYNRSLSSEEIEDIYVKGKLKFSYSDYQEVTGENQFSISTDTTHILTDYKFTAGNSTDNPFYSPILFSNIELETYDTSGGEGTSFTVTLPIGYSQMNFTSNSKTVTELEPEGQTSGAGFFQITNTGGVNLNVSLILQSLVDATLRADTDNDVTGAKTITDSSIVIKEDLTPSSSQYVWFWSNWTDKTPQTMTQQLNTTVVEN